MGPPQDEHLVAQLSFEQLRLCPLFHLPLTKLFRDPLPLHFLLVNISSPPQNQKGMLLPPILWKVLEWKMPWKV